MLGFMTPGGVLHSEKEIMFYRFWKREKNENFMSHLVDFKCLVLYVVAFSMQSNSTVPTILSSVSAPNFFTVMTFPALRQQVLLEARELIQLPCSRCELPFYLVE
jgi:hypothetical protein